MTTVNPRPTNGHAQPRDPIEIQDMASEAYVDAAIAGVVAGAGTDDNKNFPSEDLPASPSALDDNFPGVALDAKWTLVGGAAPQIPTVTVKKSWAQMRTAATSTATLGLMQQTLPAGNFSIITPVNLLMQETYGVSGLFIRSTVSNVVLVLGLHHNSGNFNDTNIAVHQYSSLTNRASVPAQNALGIYEVIFRITYDGTNLKFWFSRDGLKFRLYSTIAMTTYFTGGNLPNACGLAQACFDPTNDALAAFRSFKYTNNATGLIGAFS